MIVIKTALSREEMRTRCLKRCPACSWAMGCNVYYDVSLFTGPSGRHKRCQNYTAYSEKGRKSNHETTYSYLDRLKDLFIMDRLSQVREMLP